MNCNSSKNWHMHRRGNFWVFPLVFLGLIILTHGWILFLPLMVLAGFVFVGFVLPRIMWHMREGGWQNNDWHNRDWSEWSTRWQEKQKRHFQDWDEKPKRRDTRTDDIDYV